jgi:hypothetical protein
LSLLFRSGPAARELTPEKPEDEGEKQRNKDTGRQGEVEGKIVSLDANVPRKFAKKGDFSPEGEKEPGREKEQAGDDQNLSRLHGQFLLRGQ